MTKKLLVVFASGLILATALFLIAWVIGGRSFVADLEHKHGWSFDFDDDKAAAPATTRTLAYDPAFPLTIDAPVTLRYERGPQTRMTVEGPRELVGALRWDKGRLSLDGSHVIHGHHGLTVTVVAPQLPGLVLTGAADVELVGLDQPSLSIDLRGAGDIEARGRVSRLDVSSSGAGAIDLSGVEAEDARVRLAGLGDIDVNAGGKVDVEISGAGQVSLHRKPAQLVSRITGIGTIDQDY